MNVFEHLMELDKTGKLVPRLATGWRWLDDRTLEIKLRQGVTFTTASSSTPRSSSSTGTRIPGCNNPQARDILELQAGVAPGDPRSYTVRFVFPEPDGAALVKLSILHIGNRQFYRELGWGEKHW